MGKNKKGTFDYIDISAQTWPQKDPDYNYQMDFSGIGYGHFNEDEFEDGSFPDDASKKVGHITGWCFDFSETTIPIHDILDEEPDSSPLVEIYGSNEIRQEVFDVLDAEEFEINPYRLMVFHVLYIDPQFRGNYFSKYFFFETIKALGGGIDLFGGDVSPLQIVGWGKKATMISNNLTSLTRQPAKKTNRALQKVGVLRITRFDGSGRNRRPFVSGDAKKIAPRVVRTFL